MIVGGIPMLYSGAVVGDPYYAQRSWGLHGEGTSGGTVFTDNSPNPKTATRFGNAQTSTAQFKFGSSSMLFDGAGDYITAPSGTDFDFGTGDFTLDCWVRPAVVAGEGIYLSRQHGASGMALQLRQNGTALQLVVRGNTGLGLVVVAGGTMVTLAWQHVRACRSGNNLYLFRNGTTVGTGTTSQNLTPTISRPMVAGCTDDGAAPAGFYNGYLDEALVYKGVALSTADFTPPTAAFLDF